MTARRGGQRVAAAVVLASLMVATMLVGVCAPAGAVVEAQRSLTGFDGLSAEQDGSGVVVAVVDTGVDLDHPAFAGRLAPGWDVVDSDDRPDDPHGHGTHVAGVVTGFSGAGGGGLAPGATIMPVRVLDTDGYGSLADIAAGIEWAADHGATVINLSFGDTGRLDRIRKSGPVAAAIRKVSDRAVVVVAAGNDSQFEQIFRASVPALVVVAVDDAAGPAEFTNVGDPRAIAAPGVEVLSTAPVDPSTLFPGGTSGVAPLSGTSMAAPFVSAAAAVLLQAGAPPATVAELLRATAQPNGDPRTGAGVLDAAAAVAAVPVSADAGSTPSPLPTDSSAAPTVPVPTDPSSTPSPGLADGSLAPLVDSEQDPDNRGLSATTMTLLAIGLLALLTVLAAVYAARRR